MIPKNISTPTATQNPLTIRAITKQTTTIIAKIIRFLRSVKKVLNAKKISAISISHIWGTMIRPAMITSKTIKKFNMLQSLHILYFYKVQIHYNILCKLCKIAFQKCYKKLKILYRHLNEIYI